MLKSGLGQAGETTGQDEVIKIVLQQASPGGVEELLMADHQLPNVGQVVHAVSLLNKDLLGVPAGYFEQNSQPRSTTEAVMRQLMLVPQANKQEGNLLIHWQAQLCRTGQHFHTLSRWGSGSRLEAGASQGPVSRHPGLVSQCPCDHLAGLCAAEQQTPAAGSTQ